MTYRTPNPILAALAAILRAEPWATDASVAQRMGLAPATVTYLRRGDLLGTL